MLRRYNWKVSWTKNPLAPNRPPFYAVAALPLPKRGAASNVGFTVLLKRGAETTVGFTVFVCLIAALRPTLGARFCPSAALNPTLVGFKVLP